MPSFHRLLCLCLSKSSLWLFIIPSYSGAVAQTGFLFNRSRQVSVSIALSQTAFPDMILSTVPSPIWGFSLKWGPVYRSQPWRCSGVLCFTPWAFCGNEKLLSFSHIQILDRSSNWWVFLLCLFENGLMKRETALSWLLGSGTHLSRQAVVHSACFLHLV